MAIRTDDLDAAATSLEASFAQIRAVHEAIANKAAVSQMERDKAMSDYSVIVAERDAAVADVGRINAIADRLISLAHDAQAIYQG